MVVYASYPSYVGNINRRTVIQADLSKKQDPVSKIAMAKRAGRMAQAV
jgi:hypothetical protein